MDPPTYFKLDLIYDFLCSVKLDRLPVTSSTLEHGVRGSPKSVFPGHGCSKWLQNKLSLLRKLRAVVFTLALQS